MTASPRRGLIVLLPAALLALGFAGRLVADNAWRSFATYKTPFAFRNPHALAPPPLVDRVVIVIVDGLTDEVSRTMPFLNELRARGADATCRVGLPSLSLPGRAVLMSGSWQEIHGQTTNFNPRPLPVEHLFLTARRRGLRTALAAGPGPQTLFSPSVDDRVVYTHVEPQDATDTARLEAELRWMGETTRGLLREKEPNLYLLDLTITDETGHVWGGASPQYRAAARAADEEIRRLAGGMDLSRSVLVVTADHGHTRTGGHGGPEDSVMRVPLVLAGGPVRPGSRANAEQVDVAPTVAALLGIQIPASSQGRVLLDLLALDPESRQAILESLYQQTANFVAQYVAWVGDGSREMDSRPEGPAADVEARLADLRRQAEQARQTRLEREARARLGTLLGIALVPVLLFGGLRVLGVVSAAELSRGLLAGVAALALYHLGFPLLGLGYSFSAVNRDEALGLFFAKDMLLAVAACAVTATAAAWWGERRGPMPGGARTRLVWVAALGLASLFLVRMGVAYWRCGVFLSWTIPDQAWSFGFYLDCLALMAVGFAGVALPIVPRLALPLLRRVISRNRG